MKRSFAIMKLPFKPGLFLMFILIFFMSCETKRKRHFDSSEWIAGDREIRGSMINSLESSDTIRGRTYDEVIRLLGEPDVPAEDSSAMGYQLYTGQDIGSFGLGGPWIFWLNITFDSSGRVSDYHVSD